MQEDQKRKVILDYVTSLRSGWAKNKQPKINPVSINKNINNKRVTTLIVLKSHEALENKR